MTKIKGSLFLLFNKEEVYKLKNAVNNDADKVYDFCKQAILKELEYIEGLDRYLEEIYSEEGRGVENTHSS